MRKLAILVGGLLIAAAGVGSALAQSTGPQGNHGASVSAVAQSSCVATNPHNPSVKNHGQCVKQAAQQNHGHGQAKGNHGASVSAAARSTCVAMNPHNSKVKNHGQCVKQGAQKNGNGAKNSQGKGSGPKPKETETPGH